MPNLIKKVQNTTFEHNLFPRGSKIILACSGGPDSTALFDIFFRLQKKYTVELVIAHVNYHLRGKESDKDERFVRKLAEKYNLDVFVYNSVETPCLPAGRQFIASGNSKKLRNAKTRLIASLRNSSEDVLRKIRYDFFEKIRQELNFDYIAVGHTLDDQVETFLMRIIRGAGMAGLSSMAYKNNHLIRPLLNISKSEILKYLKENKLAYRIDKTNLESKFTRNKVRNGLIPYLEKNYNSKIKNTIFNAVESIREDYDFLEKIAKDEFEKNKPLSVGKILALHPSLQKQLLLSAIREKKGDLKDIQSVHAKELLKIVKSTKNKSQVVLFQSLKIIRKGDRLNIEYNKSNNNR